MIIECDPVKRLWTIEERGLDMANAGQVFEGPHITAEDARFSYGEPRHITVGYLDGRMVVLVWTRRDSRIRMMLEENQ